MSMSDRARPLSDIVFKMRSRKAVGLISRCSSHSRYVSSLLIVSLVNDWLYSQRIQDSEHGYAYIGEYGFP